MCLFQIPLIRATVAPLIMPDYPTRMSISATMCLSSSCSHPPCYLQDRDEIADDVIIAQSRNRYVKVSAVPHSAIRHKLTGYGRIHKNALSWHKSLISVFLTPMISAFCTARSSFSASLAAARRKCGDMGRTCRAHVKMVWQRI